MPPSSGELWGHPVMPSSVLVDCLLPNGIVIQLGCVRDAPLNVIKGKLTMFIPIENLSIASL
jgi:phosphatidylinositol-4,5-bisphosphate 3-kinase